MSTPLAKAGRPRITIIQAMTDPELFGRVFAPPQHWQPWVVLLKALFGLPMTEAEAVIFSKHTGRTTCPTKAAREA